MRNFALSPILGRANAPKIGVTVQLCAVRGNKSIFGLIGNLLKIEPVDFFIPGTYQDGKEVTVRYTLYFGFCGPSGGAGGGSEGVCGASAEGAGSGASSRR